MLDLQLNEIDEIRASGYRPQVIGVITCDHHALFVYQKEYNLWMFPQGGIDNHETLEDAFWREMTEELGSAFVSKLDRSLTFIMEDQSTFPPAKQGSRSVATDAGVDVFMKGKVYFVIHASSSDNQLDITETEFDDYKWVNFDEAQNLIKTIYQTGKQRITREIIKALHEKGLIH